jgi:hypothetical protein
VDQPTQNIPPVDTQAIGRLAGRIRPRVRRPEIQTTVGPLSVVVGDIGPKDPLQMSAAKHQRPVQALGPDGPDPSFGDGARGGWTGVRMTWMPSLANTASKLEAYFESRSLTRNRKVPPLASSSDTFLACWVTQAEAGLLVAPAR